MPYLSTKEPGDKRLRLLVVGALSELEFPGVRAALQEPLLQSEGPCAVELVTVVDAEAAIDRLSSESFDLVLYAQPRPAVSLVAHDCLYEVVGEAMPCVQLLGTWCEGEGRTGRVPDGWQRVFWHAMPRWWRQYSKNSLAHIAESPRTEGMRVVEVHADYAFVDALRDALLPEGWLVYRAVPGEAALGFAGIWVGKQLGGAEADCLSQFCQRFSQRAGMAAPVVALLDFPRRETVTAARAVGAADVVALPCDTLELVEALERAVPSEDVALPAAEWLFHEPLELEEVVYKAA